MDVCVYEIASLQHPSTDHYENWHLPTRWRYTKKLLLRSIHRQVANIIAKNDANLALSPTFHYVSIESPLQSFISQNL
ncbi:UNVERIFIED_CONTAM: hypothetical protein NCL1_25755 [Trichonephila clavipes]